MKTQFAGIRFLMPLLFVLMTLCSSFMVRAQIPDWQNSIHGSDLHNFKKYEAKDKALNLCYRDLKAQLSEDEFSQLRDVQISWVRYKENACDHAPYFGADLDVPELDPSAKWMICLCKAEVAEARLLELQYLASRTQNSLT